MFEVRNIAFSYSGEKILRDVSFVVSPGEAVSIVGDNGTGKTTLLKVLSTLAVPCAGHIQLDGNDAFAKPLKYRRLLGYMAEDAALYPDMTVKGYLEYRARLKGEPDKRIRRRVAEAAEMCELSRLMKKTVRSLSPGLKKRIALADAILLRPRVLLLDDFLAGLDRNMREASGSIISQVAAFSSVIVTGHEIADFAKWTTRFLVLKDGVISSVIPSAGVPAEELASRVCAAMKGSPSK